MRLGIYGGRLGSAREHVSSVSYFISIAGL